MTKDLFVENREEIAKTNAYLLKRIALGACANMSALSVASPFLSGFCGAEWLYVICAVLTGGLALYGFLRLDRRPGAALPLFYALLTGLCGYAVALSAFFYSDIHGVTIIGIFVLMPILVLDRAWRVNLAVLSLFSVASVIGFLRKPMAIAVDDCTTSGAFLAFGILIGGYLRKIRISAIVQQRETERQRDYDALTALPNRRLLFETLGKIDAGTDARPLDGMLMIDVDDFKRYNDERGHQAGDECLRKLGAFLTAFARENGLVIYRYGGEEFLGLWRREGGGDIGEIARRLIEEQGRGGIGGDGVTISVGYASSRAGVGSERLISMADTALYEAKRKGKRRAEGYSAAAERGAPPSESFRRRK